jgi:hypothetical protein
MDKLFGGDAGDADLRRIANIRRNLGMLDQDVLGTTETVEDVDAKLESKDLAVQVERTSGKSV